MIKQALAALAAAVLGCTPALAQFNPGEGTPAVSGAASTTGTTATQLIAAPTNGQRIYVKAAQCGRTDGATGGLVVTLSDLKSSNIVVPDSGGGGGNNPLFDPPLPLAPNTALTFASGTPVTTLYCNAQGFLGP